MTLEKPRLNTGGDLNQRVQALERYLYRLVEELEAVIRELEEEYGKEL